MKADILEKSIFELQFRIQKQVTEVRKTANSYFPVCPGCNTSLEREYQSYCDRCGQALSWWGFRRAKVEKNT